MEFCIGFMNSLQRKRYLTKMRESALEYRQAFEEILHPWGYPSTPTFSERVNCAVYWLRSAIGWRKLARKAKIIAEKSS